LQPGKIVDNSGKVLGEHSGLHGFTIGQRKGLGVFSNEPLYVLALEKTRNEVIVGPETALFRKYCTVSNLNWINPPNLDKPRELAAKIRYRASESPVEVRPLLDNRVEVHFKEPQRAITPGQAMVFYEGARVLGGGWIEDLSVN